MAATAIPDLYTQTQGSVAVEREDLMIADDLLIARARDRNQVPLLCFPRSEQGTTEYDKFTGKDIDRMVDHAAKHLLSHGLRCVGFCPTALLRRARIADYRKTRP